jgi:signal transduction histidine kinase/tetratricopeptide (TPR) repeat protein
MRLDWQRRAIILFAASLFVLSVVLVLFALREAEREKLLDEKEFEGRQRRLVESVDARAGALIRESENRVLPAGKRIRPDADAAQAAAELKSFLVEIPLVSEIFVADRDGEAVFLGARPLYLLPGERSWFREVAPQPESDERWRRAETAEFRQNDYSLAAAIYGEMAAGAADRDRRALLLNRQARCRAKSGRYEQALSLYREQLRIGLPEITSAAIPLEILALYQIGNIQFRQGRMTDAAGTFLELYRGLLDSKWPLTRDQFESFRNWAEDRFRASAGEIEPALRADWESRFRDLKKEEQGRLNRTEVLAKVGERILPRIRVDAGAVDPDSGEFRHIAETTDSEGLLASFFPLNKKVIVAMLFDGQALARELIAPDSRLLEKDESLSVMLVDDAGNVVAGSSQPFQESPAERGGSEPIHTAAFAESFPPWTIQIHQNKAGAMDRRFRLKRSLYVLSLAAVVAALSFGGFLAIRSTARELKLAKLKSDFAATVSHEFRTPLTSIRYLSELLQRGRVPDEERKREYYGTITGESERLSRLVENLLDFSKIESGMKEYTMEQTDIAALVSETAERFRRQAGLKDFSLETEISDGLPTIRADREALDRAVFNLFDNAVKYSGGNPRVVLRAWPAEGNVFLRVEDNGIGIGKAEQKRVFEKFYRSAKASESEVKGSGIGLTLVDHVVKAHGGKVILESEPGRGTRVTIRLPFEPADHSKGGEHG